MNVNSKNSGIARNRGRKRTSKVHNSLLAKKLNALLGGKEIDAKAREWGISKHSLRRFIVAGVEPRSTDLRAIIDGSGGDWEWLTNSNDPRLDEVSETKTPQASPGAEERKIGQQPIFEPDPQCSKGQLCVHLSTLIRLVLDIVARASRDQKERALLVGELDKVAALLGKSVAG